MHVDNIAPSLFGGLVLTVGIDHPARQADPGARAASARSSCIRTCFSRPARRSAILKRSVELSDFVWQTANLAGFISGCYTNDLDMIRASFEDVVIEPQRQALIPGFQGVRLAAMTAGALGCSISGAGPALFAWVLANDARRGPRGHARRVCGRLHRIDEWLVDIGADGARVIDSG